LSLHNKDSMGVMSMIISLFADVDEEMAEADTNEENAQADYETLMKDPASERTKDSNHCKSQNRN